MEKDHAVHKRKKLNTYYDYSLLVLTIFIVLFGVVMIYSASFYSASTSIDTNYDPLFFVKSQTRGIILGVVAMLMISKIDYRWFIAKKLPVIHLNLAQCAYVGALILQIAVLFIGIESHGAKRWMRLGPIQFQPSELSKIAAILMVSYMIYLAPRAVNNIKGLLKIVIFMAPIIVLIAKENLSAAIIVSAIVAGICFVASRKKWYFILLLGVAVIAVVLFLNFGDSFRMERIEVWRDLEGHEKGYQILQGLYAIASGGLFGTGLGQSMQKLGFIPESQNDMIFSIICEELGLVGAGVVVFMFILLLWRILIVANSAPDLFGGLICTGVMVQIAVQVILNIAVVSNFIPSTGIALPFISCGGTSVSILLAEMGLVLSVSNQIRR